MSFYSAIMSLALVCYLGLIYVVVHQGLRGNHANQLFCVYLATMVLWQLAYLMVSISRTPIQALAWYSMVVVVASGQFTVFFAFTRSFLHIRGQKRMVHAGLALWTLILFLAFLRGGRGFFDSIHRHPATGLYVPTFGVLVTAVAGPNYFFLVSACYNLIRAYRSSHSDFERGRIQYLLLGMGVVVAGTVCNFFPSLQPYPIDVAANIINALFIAYAILRYQLLDVKLVIRKGLVYSIPTAILSTAYFLLISWVLPFFRVVAGQQVMISVALATLTALIAQPLRDRVQFWIDRLFFREKYNSSLMLQRLSQSVASVLDLGKLTDMILDAVLTTMHVEKAALLLKHEESGEFRLSAQRNWDWSADAILRTGHPVVQWMTQHERPLTQYDIEVEPSFRALWQQERDNLVRIGAELFVPLKAKGGLVGIFAVGRKRSEEIYSHDDQLTLTTLANQTAVAIENARLYESAQRELVERKRVEQQLQDLNVTLEDRVAQRTSDLELLFELSQKVGYTLDSTELSRLVLEQLHRAVPFDVAASVMVVADHCEFFVQPARRHLVEMKQEIWNRYARSKVAQRIPTATAEKAARWHEAAPLDEDAQPFEGIGSFLEVPLVAGSASEVEGALMVFAERAGAFSEDHKRLLYTVAMQTSVAMQRLRALLAAEQRRQENLVESLPEGLLLLDAKGRVVLANPAGQSYLSLLATCSVGETLTSLGGRPIEQLLAPPPDGQMCHEVVLEGSIARVFEITSQNIATGSQANGLLLIVREVTERKQAETERVKLEQQLRQAQKMEAVGLLAGGVAHEFNNMLTVIQGNAELGMLRLEPDSPLRLELSTVQRTAQRAAKLTHQLLAFSRRQVLQSGEVDLNELIKGFAEMLRRLIGEHIALQLDLAPGLEPVSADEAALEQALLNLAVNARDAMPAGGILRFATASVKIDEWYCQEHSEASPGSYVRVTVTDSGIGMDAATLSHLFEPFFTTKGVGKGTGLGLAMVYGVVKQHGGWIEVQSQPGKGTSFDVFLPNNGKNASKRSTEVESISMPMGAETILLAEDEVDVRDFGQTVLKGLGYKVLSAGDGQSAVDVFAANRDNIRLVILDVVMPKLSGPNAYEAMKAVKRGVPALFITGYNAEMAGLPVQVQEGVYRLQKPFALADLAHKVRDALDGRPATRASVEHVALELEREISAVGAN